MANRLRDALLDAIDARDTLVKRLADDGAAHARRAVAGIVVAAALPTATPESVAAAARGPEARRRIQEALAVASLHAEAHAMEHMGRLRQVSPGADEGPVTRAELLRHVAARILG